MLGPLACATDGAGAGCTGGCAGEVAYPYDEPGAIPTDRALRFRVTEAGIQFIAQGFSSILSSICRVGPIGRLDGGVCS